MGPTVPSCRPRSQASRTWPRISVSPSTAESSPAATANRWATAGVVVVDVEVVAEVLRREERHLGEEVADVLVGAVEALGDRVDLGAVARGEHDGLGDVLAGDEVVEGLGQRGVADGHPLEQVERGASGGSVR